jgi:glutamine amidotransferase
MIAIMNYGIGNLGSVKNALDYLGFDSIITSDKEVKLSSDKVILPGVGAFNDAIETFKSYGFIEVVNELIKKNTPILGICVGMQLLFEESEEYGIHKGLVLLKGRIVKFPQEKDNITYKIPQIGWNQIEVMNDNKLLNGLDNKEVYFVHSYYLDNPDKEDVIVTTEYAGITYASAVRKGNLYATQFHPEKSGEVGLAILKNFCCL